MHQGLAPASISIVWLLLVFPILLQCPTPLVSQPEFSYFSKRKNHQFGHSATSNILSRLSGTCMSTSSQIMKKCCKEATALASYCWKKFHDQIFQLPTRRIITSKTHSSKISSATYSIPSSRKRGVCIGRKRGPQFARMFCLATLAQSTATAYASGLSQPQKSLLPKPTRSFAAFDTDSATL